MLRVITAAKFQAVRVPGESSGFQGIQYPHDPSDFGRCVRLLEAEPKLREHLHLLAEGHGAQWKALIENWPQLESLYLQELPSGLAPRLLARMEELLNANP